MIGKVCPRGQDLAGLIRYLYGPGRREEHTDPHIVAGYRPPQDLEPPLRANGSRDSRRLIGLLRLPHDALGKWGYAKPVWHTSMRAAYKVIRGSLDTQGVLNGSRRVATARRRRRARCPAKAPRPSAPSSPTRYTRPPWSPQLVNKVLGAASARCAERIVYGALEGCRDKRST